MGLAFSILMVGADLGGLMIGRQAGIALGQVFNPSQDTEATITGQLYTIVVTLIFLGVGGHRATVAALLDTYRTIPLLSYEADASIIDLLITALTSAFALGIRIAGPVLIALFLAGVALAVLSRTMPQINILTVGFTIRVMITLGMAGLAICACSDAVIQAIWDVTESVRSAFGLDPLHTRLAY